MKTKGVPMKVRLQWDPDYWPNHDRINQGRRAIQLGIPGDLLIKLSKEYILKIEDATEVARNGRTLVNKFEQLYVPVQRVFEIEEKEIRTKIMDA